MSSVQWIPGGDIGTWLTLRKMRQLVRSGVRDTLTVETAHSIVKSCPSRDVRCEAQAIRAFLARSFRFVRDPARQETLRSPRHLLEQLGRDGVVSGDCDDAAILGAGLAAAIGFIPSAVVTGFRHPGASFQHVYAVLPLEPYAPGYVDLDVTRPDGPVPQVTRALSWKLV